MSEDRNLSLTWKLMAHLCMTEWEGGASLVSDCAVQEAVLKGYPCCFGSVISFAVVVFR